MLTRSLLQRLHGCRLLSQFPRFHYCVLVGSIFETQDGSASFNFVPGLVGYDKYGTGESSAGKEVQVEDVTGTSRATGEEQAVEPIELCEEDHEIEA